MTDASIERGRELYASKVTNCVFCHGADGKGNDPDKWLTKEQQKTVPNPDLTLGKFKGGDGPYDLYQRMSQAIMGSQHPGYANLAEREGEEALWALVHYVYHISGKRPEEAEHVRRPPPKDPPAHPEDEMHQAFPASVAEESAPQAGWGKWQGKIIYAGDAPSPREINVTKDRSVVGGNKLFDPSLQVHPENGGLMNVVIWFELKQPGGLMQIHESLAKAPEEPVVMQQKLLQFEPHILALRTSQKLEFKNTDPVAQSVRVETRALGNSPFAGVVPSERELFYGFNNPERLPLDVTSSIHPWMRAYLVVKDHPYFAVTDENGVFEFPILPAGRWKVRFWHERIGTLTELEADDSLEQQGKNFFVKISADKTTECEIQISPELFEQQEDGR